MLTIQSLREEKDRILAALDKRHFDAREAIQQVLEWDAERRKTQAKLDDESVVLSWRGIRNPVAVRYAFSGFPDVNLVNGAGLPALPFRTDSDVPPGYNNAPTLVGDKHRRK